MFSESHLFHVLPTRSELLCEHMRFNNLRWFPLFTQHAFATPVKDVNRIITIALTTINDVSHVIKCSGEP